MRLDRIKIDPIRVNGQPSIRDLRLTVKRVLEIMAIYPSRQEICIEYPELEDEDIRQSLVYAAEFEEASAEIEADNAEWDALLASDESQTLLTKLADEAIAEHKSGKTKPMIFNDDGRMIPFYGSG